MYSSGKFRSEHYLKFILIKLPNIYIGTPFTSIAIQCVVCTVLAIVGPLCYSREQADNYLQYAPTSVLPLFRCTIKVLRVKLQSMIPSSQSPTPHSMP